MSSPTHSSRSRRNVAVVIVTMVFMGILLTILNRRSAPRLEQSPPIAGPTSTTPTTNAISNATPAVPTPAPSFTNFSDFKKRPFPIAITGTNYEWVAADGKDTNVIRQLAHNEWEYRRMVDENDRINRRQLVYNQNPAAAVMQQARLTGVTVTQLTLPGFDGQELPFLIQRADLTESQQGGTFAGHLRDRPNSLVTLAFQFGREAFTVMSPDDNLYLQGHPRESGELIVTSFDPEKYLSVPGGEPIRTTNDFKIAQ